MNSAADFHFPENCVIIIMPELYSQLIRTLKRISKPFYYEYLQQKSKQNLDFERAESKLIGPVLDFGMDRAVRVRPKTSDQTFAYLLATNFIRYLTRETANIRTTTSIKLHQIAVTFARHVRASTSQRRWFAGIASVLHYLVGGSPAFSAYVDSLPSSRRSPLKFL